MDIELARTFLEIVSAGSFVRAAERLHVTQTAVSARVQALETQLGRPLFVRNKSGARLTPAGRDFLQYATQLVQIWERARHQVAVPPGRETVLSLGGEFSLWNSLLLNWLVWLRRDRNTVALRSHVEAPDRLMDRLQSSALDIAILYAPYHRPDVKITPILSEDLIAVTTDPDNRTLSGENYVYVDWGPDFANHHDTAFPGLKDAGTFVDLGPLGLRYILEAGGSGYFRTRAIQRFIDEERLFPVESAPTFSYSVYAAYSRRAPEEIIDWALNGLREVAKQSFDKWV